ncbi:6-carboxytetrahydropterin synthase QueD [Virgisporangium aurantiacum]|uniref:6-carboxy-5,6,7,8-tetrahydropterin synthase n=1 Tax=Virgisporangium aurantiacum TaxID=175570 RepID=A0A8J3ZGG7_9ACTN|nr:6-carboxytetrahydropterin synthase QueD [Virgisporangium aurantiacum]GIJ63677.1 6-carboxy-5,6,7,8-tetrahydropterin synthase [Virgisporangium aurantiacum]
MTRTASVTRSFSFDAAHQLPWHPGKCARLHGHTYRLEVTATGPVGTNGIVIDFADLKSAVERDLIDRLDHTLLNDSIDNPTAERVALHILDTLVQRGLPVTRIRLWETPDCCVEVHP